MGTLLVGYDKHQGEDYGPLEDALKKFPGWWHHLDSTWLVSTPNSATQVRDQLGALLDDKDRLLVVEISGDHAAWRGFDAEASQWIKEHL